MKSRNVPRIGRFVTLTFVEPSCTGCEPPSGSTICAVSLAATGFPPRLTVTEYVQCAPTFGVWPAPETVTFSVAAEPPSRLPSAATVTAPATFTIAPRVVTERRGGRAGTRPATPPRRRPELRARTGPR